MKELIKAWIRYWDEEPNADHSFSSFMRWLVKNYSD